MAWRVPIQGPLSTLRQPRRRRRVHPLRRRLPVSGRPLLPLLLHCLLPLLLPLRPCRPVRRLRPLEVLQRWAPVLAPRRSDA
jgi:hypothetical protein